MGRREVGKCAAIAMTLALSSCGSPSVGNAGLDAGDGSSMVARDATTFDAAPFDAEANDSAADAIVAPDAVAFADAAPTADVIVVDSAIADAASSPDGGGDDGGPVACVATGGAHCGSMSTVCASGQVCVHTLMGGVLPTSSYGCVPIPDSCPSDCASCDCACPLLGPGWTSTCEVVKGGSMLVCIENPG